VRLVAFAECGTMALLGAAFDSAGVGDRELAGRLLGRLAPGMFVLADRGFASFELWRDAVASGADLAWRVSASFALPVIERLDDGTYLSRVRGRRKHEQITVRVVEFSVKDADTGVSEVFALITTLLDPLAHRALELAWLYAARWQVELLFKILKVQLRESGAVLRSRSPAMVRQEIWGLLCCYQAVRLVTAHAAARAHVEVGRVRFPALLDAVRDSLATAISPCTLERAQRHLIADLPGLLIRVRPPRSTPRVLQRPGRGWPTRKPDTPRTRLADRERIVHRLPASPVPQPPPLPLPDRPAGHRAAPTHHGQADPRH
jgi:hypothetical protein